MRYRIRDGVALLNIHDVYLLAADEKACEECGYLRELNETGAYIFQQMMSGLSESEIAENMKLEFEVSNEEELLDDIHEFIRYLNRHKYLEIKDGNEL